MTNRIRPLLGLTSVVCGALALFAAQCSSPASQSGDSTKLAAASAGDRAAALAAWNVVYGVLEHPRCANCHPAGDAPLQGDDGHPHAQNVQRGPDGKGVYALRCDACHTTQNFPGAHLPPGAPNWHLPSKAVPMVFQGRSSSELCRQLKDRAQNGNRSPAELLEHVAHDPLVLWGWQPGEGRAPVSTSHAAFVAAMRTWVDNGCDCP